jgi:hypothetical protein
MDKMQPRQLQVNDMVEEILHLPKSHIAYPIEDMPNTIIFYYKAYFLFSKCEKLLVL